MVGVNAIERLKQMEQIAAYLLDDFALHDMLPNLEDDRRGLAAALAKAGVMLGCLRISNRYSLPSLSTETPRTAASAALPLSGIIARPETIPSCHDGPRSHASR